MKKTMKIFGIGAAVLMIILCATPMAYSTSTVIKTVRIQHEEAIATTDNIVGVTTVTEGIPSDSFDSQALDQIFIQYQAEIEEIDQYIADYIAIHGGIGNNFALPPDLQASYDIILSEIWGLIGYGSGESNVGMIQLTQRQSQSIIGEQINPVPLGGINKVESYLFFDWLGPGMFYRIWLDSGWSSRIVQYGPVSLALVALCLFFASAGTLATVAFSLASLIVGGYITEIAVKNHGNGVIIHYKDYLLWGVVFDSIEGIWSQ